MKNEQLLVIIANAPGHLDVLARINDTLLTGVLDTDIRDGMLILKLGPIELPKVVDTKSAERIGELEKIINEQAQQIEQLTAPPTAAVAATDATASLDFEANVGK